MVVCRWSSRSLRTGLETGGMNAINGWLTDAVFTRDTDGPSPHAVHSLLHALLMVGHPVGRRVCLFGFPSAFLCDSGTKIHF